MKLLIEQFALQKGVGRAANVVARRNTIPILNNILIDAESVPGELWLIATDLDMEVRVRVDGQIVEPGRITAPAGLLSDIARNAPSGAEVSLAYDGSDPRLQVRFGRSRFNVPVLPAEDFPSRRSVSWAAELTLPAVDFGQMLGRTAFAMSTEETRYYLNGVFLHLVVEEGRPRLRTAATDGHRLAWAEVDGSAFPKDWRGVIVPQKAISEFRRAVDGFAGDVTVAVAAEGVRLQTADVTLTSKVVDGDYPDYQRPVPRTWDHEARVDRGVLMGAIGRAAIMGTERTNPIKLDFAEGRMTVTVKNDQSGLAVEELELDYDGKPFEAGYNARYLLDALKQTEADEVRLCLNDADGPLRIEPVPSDPEHGAALAVVMPQRV